MSITVTGETLCDLRMKLGFHYPQMTMAVVNEGGKARIRVRIEGSDRTFISSFQAARFIRQAFDRKIKEIKAPVRKKPLKAKRRR